MKIVIVLVLGQHNLGPSVWRGAYTDACKDTITVCSIVVYAGVEATLMAPLIHNFGAGWQ